MGRATSENNAYVQPKETFCGQVSK